MPRHKLKSDDDVLDAANAVLKQKGGTEFTLADVARQVGLSRPALIQRFTNKTQLLRRMAEREVSQTRAYLESLPMDASPKGLENFLTEIIESMGRGNEFVSRVHLAWTEATDPTLSALARTRYDLVISAIAARLPEQYPDKMATAAMLHAVIAGATMQWVVSEDNNLAQFVLKRIRTALALI